MNHIIDTDEAQARKASLEIVRRLSEKRHQKPIIEAEEVYYDYF